MKQIYETKESEYRCLGHIVLLVTACLLTISGCGKGKGNFSLIPAKSPEENPLMVDARKRAEMGAAIENRANFILQVFGQAGQERIQMLRPDNLSRGSNWTLTELSSWVQNLPSDLPVAIRMNSYGFDQGAVSNAAHVFTARGFAKIDILAVQHGLSFPAAEFKAEERKLTYTTKP